MTAGKTSFRRLVRLLWPKLPIHDHPPSGNLFLADPERPHRQPVLVMGAAGCLPDRHERVERFENADRAGCLTVLDRGAVTCAVHRG